MSLPCAAAVAQGAIDPKRTIRNHPTWSPIQWAEYACHAPIQYVGIGLRRPHLLVTQQFLHGPDIGSGFEQMGGEAMSQGVWADRLDDASPAGGRLSGALQPALVQMMTLLAIIEGVDHPMGGRENARPAQFALCVAVLSGESTGQRRGPESASGSRAWRTWTPSICAWKASRSRSGNTGRKRPESALTPTLGFNRS